MIAPLSLQQPIFARYLAKNEVRMTQHHTHDCGQLLQSNSGLLSLDTADSRWVVPATQAIWIPPQVVHAMRSHGQFSGWSLYITAEACTQMPPYTCTLQTSGLLNEAVLRAMKWRATTRDDKQKHLEQVIIDEMTQLEQVALGLPLPQDSRLLRSAQKLITTPDDDRSLAAWAEYSQVSMRTFSRQFRKETGFTFTQWRQRVRILAALEKLAAGESVKSIALSSGYDNVSAFIAMFKSVLGTTPARYF